MRKAAAPLDDATSLDGVQVLSAPQYSGTPNHRTKQEIACCPSALVQNPSELYTARFWLPHVSPWSRSTTKCILFVFNCGDLRQR